MATSLHKHFINLDDPRVERTKKHPLINILLIAICGVICGAENWVSIERFGRSKEKWFRHFLDLSSGIPSHDTFNRVFSIIDSEAFGAHFSEWVNTLMKQDKEIIAIDGKAMRATKNRIDGEGCLYLVNAWCTANQVVLGQIKVDKKSNEINAIPRLLDLLDVEDSIITIDAMGCQKSIAHKVREKKADYVLALKGNQGEFHEDICLYLKSLESKALQSSTQYHQTLDGDHGRIETREYWVSDHLGWLHGKDAWQDLKTLIMVKSTREMLGEKSHEYRFYISSLALKSSEKIYKAVRKHWEVENKLHWNLDVSFNEDRSRSKKGEAAPNVGLLNKIALNLLKQEKTAKVGIKNKRLMAGWDEKYLLKVLNHFK